MATTWLHSRTRRDSTAHLRGEGLFLFTHDALSALTWLSAIGGALALAMTWWLARMCGRSGRVAWLATGCCS